MAMALIPLPHLLAPLQALATWLAPARRAQAAAPARAQPRALPPRTSRPLRVVRVVEAGSSRASAGRLVISGRMADVCAELERLAAQEAARS